MGRRRRSYSSRSLHMKLASRFCRICWNANRWLSPSGGAKRESGTHAEEKGFGYDEWLANPAFRVGRYRYAFLQPFSGQKPGLLVRSVVLYTLAASDSPRKRYVVGNISNCERLSESEAAAVVSHLKRQGVIRRMQKTVEALSLTGHARVDIASKPAIDIINVRFLPEDLTLFRSRRPAPSQVDRFDHYSLYRDQSAPARSGRGPMGSETVT